MICSSMALESVKHSLKFECHYYYHFHICLVMHTAIRHNQPDILNYILMVSVYILCIGIYLYIYTLVTLP